ncbi:MAG: hypothetical protein ACJ8CB_30625, partial [Ktedonobacteraceae bacterium]
AMVCSRPLPKDASPTSVTITKDCADCYFMSMLVEEDIKHLPHSEQSIGADLGLKSFVDINAARNILAAGLAVSACGEAVRPGAVKTKVGAPRRSRKA